MNCNRLAPFYQSLEYLSFGKSLEHRRFAFLEEIRGSERALVCGGGDGRFLARLLAGNAAVEVDFVDLSAKMIELAERRISRMGASLPPRARFCLGDIRDFEPRSAGYDLIVTHFFLDCFSQLEITAIVARLASWAAPGAQWIISDFREAEGAISRIWSRWIIQSLYSAFRLSTKLQVRRLPDYAPFLIEAGFQRKQIKYACGGLLYSSLWARQDRFESVS